MAEEDECSGFPHSNACVVWAMRTGETLCPAPRSTSSPTVVQDGKVVIEGEPFRSPWREGGPYVTKSGKVLTDEDVQALADEEERLHWESEARYVEGGESGGCA